MGWYYVITEDVRESFEGKEADVFAVINGFSQEGQGCFYGSLARLSSYCGIKSKTTTQTILKKLVEKGAIFKEEGFHDGVKFCSYSVNPHWRGISKIDMGMPKIDMGGISKFDTNNKEDIKVNNKERDIQRFTPPTIEDVKAYCEARGNGIDAEEFVAFYSSKGWMVGKSKMKDWRSAIITWEKARSRERKVAPKERRKESVFEHNLKVADEMFGTNYHEKVYGKKEVDCDDQ